MPPWEWRKSEKERKAANKDAGVGKKGGVREAGLFLSQGQVVPDAVEKIGIMEHAHCCSQQR